MSHRRSTLEQPQMDTAAGLLSSLTLPIPNVTIPWPLFDPPVHTRSDGAPFVVHGNVGSCDWIPLLLNSLLSLRRHGIHNITVLSEKPCITHLLHTLGYYAYNPWPTTVRNSEPYYAWPRALSRSQCRARVSL